MNIISRLFGNSELERKLQKENAELRQTITSQSITLKNQQTHVDDLKENNRKLYAYNNELIEENKNLQNEIEVLMTAKDEQDAIIDGLRDTVNGCYQSNDDLMKRLNELKRKNAMANGRISAYIRKFGELPHKREKQRNRKPNGTANEA